MENIRVIFVLPEDCSDPNEASDIMIQAYESCKQNVVNVSWVEEFKFQTIDFSKTDFVVFQDFKGKNFDSLKESKCARILGPWCILVCLMEGRPIPNFTWPIYNVAMMGCVISSSHITKSRKMEIKEKVQLMGGCYTDSLMSTNTHLVTESVKSEKYLHAAEAGLKLFVSQWVDAVWEASQNNNVHCDDEQFQKYKCLPFHNLTISSTGFPNVDMRTEVARIVVKYGGTFTANLAVSTTDVLIVHGESGLSSKKYKAARSNPNIYCVSVDWINDSISKGYALSHNLYTVAKKGTSTPTKEDVTCPNFSIISAIGDTTTKGVTSVEETFFAKKAQLPTFNNRISPNKRKCSESEVGKLIDGLDIKKAKRAGQYLDGCNVYLAGFKPDQREKLSKILNLSGATRYDDISDRLTHIIVGDTNCPEVKIIKSKNYSVTLVSIHWLLESMEKKQSADEENYLINLHDCDNQQFSSPLGRKGLSLLRSNRTLTSNDIEAANTSMKTNEEDSNIDDELMQQYLKPPSVNDDSDTLAQLLKNNSNFNSRPGETLPQATKTTNEYSQMDDVSSQDINFFSLKKFVIINFSTEELPYIKEQIESVGGTVMLKSYKGIPDYVVAPAFIKAPIQESALEVVNHFWINNCIQENKEVAIEYFHRPLVVSDNDPLKNCVVTISGYAATERNFLRELIGALGGISQEQFARVSCVEKNVKASTHLISLEADGKKYAAALKWGLPVVSKDWLFECAKTGTFVSEKKFLMGDSKDHIRKSFESSDPKTKNVTPKRDAPSSTSMFKKLSTPLSQIQPLDVNKSQDKTPTNQRLFKDVAGTPCTQVTPINKLMEEVRKTNLLGTPQTPPMPKTWYDVDTPESPFGAFIRPQLSPKSKKELIRHVSGLTDFVPPSKGRKSTPLSEVKRRCWQKLLGQQEGISSSQFTQNRTETSNSHLSQLGSEMDIDDDKIEDSNLNDQEEFAKPIESTSEINDEDALIRTKLKNIEEMVSALGENRRSSRAFESTVPPEVANSTRKESQAFTVGWDYNDFNPTPKEQMRIFIISGVENDQRQEIIEKIERLGGHVSDLSTYDPKCTHLICTKPARNEKTLSCIASGKWILHISYVDNCVAAGKFLPEEEFEFGNPKSKENIKVTFYKENELKTQAIHWWRQEISRRGYGAFNDMRAIVVAQKRDSIVRVIEAGGGQVVDASPPFSDNIHATHCFLEMRSVPDFNVYNPLAKQGILCINTLYISDFLFRTNKDIKDAIVPHLSKYYS